MALDGQKRGMSAAQSNKHMCDMLSAAGVKIPNTSDSSVVERDVDIDDYFKLADLQVKGCRYYLGILLYRRV